MNKIIFSKKIRQNQNFVKITASLLQVFILVFGIIAIAYALGSEVGVF